MTKIGMEMEMELSVRYMCILNGLIRGLQWYPREVVGAMGRVWIVHAFSSRHHEVNLWWCDYGSAKML